jgi:hypothetical protein
VFNYCLFKQRPLSQDVEEKLWSLGTSIAQILYFVFFIRT